MTDLPTGEAAALAQPTTFELEAAFQGALQRLRTEPRREWGRGLLLVGTLALFLLFQLAGGGTLVEVAVLVGVLLLHEGGHWVAMRSFGYTDLRMFFIPGFGAAVAGRAAGVPAWKQAVVALAGPVPGILLGVALAAAIRVEGTPLARTAAFMLVAINAFNLLPLTALDGGKVLELTLFQRQRWLEVLFLVLAALGMGVAAFLLEERALVYLALLSLVGLPARVRLVKAAHALRGTLPGVPGGLHDAEGPGGREIFRAAWDMSRAGRGGDARDPATLFEQLLTHLARAVPSWRQASALVVVWGLALGASAGAVWLLRHPAMWWRTVADPGGRYRIDLPAEPVVREDAVPTRGEGALIRRVGASFGDYGFTLIDVPVAEASAEALEAAWGPIVEGLREDTGGEVLFDRPAEIRGRPGREARLLNGEQALRLYAFHHAGHRLMLVTMAPSGDEAPDRFVESLVLLE